MDHLADADERDPVEALAGFPAELQRLLDGYSDDALRKPASDGGWSVLENLCHLSDWEAVFLDRAQAIRDRDRPDLPAYDDALWEIERNYREQDPAATLARFAARRGEMVELLAGLDAAGWEREGVHALLGPISMRWIAGYLVDHDRGHLEQIGDALH